MTKVGRRTLYILAKYRALNFATEMNDSMGRSPIHFHGQGTASCLLDPLYLLP